MQVELLDVNEFSPEFERSSYSFQLELRNNNDDHDDEGQDQDEQEDEIARRLKRTQETTEWCHLLTVRAHDQDCSLEFGHVCRYELLGDNSAMANASEFAIDLNGKLAARCVWLERLRANGLRDEVASHQQRTYALQVVAFDCGGKKSQAPASVQVTLVATNSSTATKKTMTAAAGLRQPLGACRASWKGKYKRSRLGSELSRANPGLLSRGFARFLSTGRRRRGQLAHLAAAHSLNLWPRVALALAWA